MSTDVKAGTTVARITGTTNAAPSLTVSPTTTTQPTVGGIFSEANLQRHVDAVFADVPKDHTWATVWYGAYENGQFVTKFALVHRSADGSFRLNLEAQYASQTGAGAGIWVKKSW